MNPKLKYLLTCSPKAMLGQGRRCPSCGSGNSAKVDSKFVVTQLRRCAKCQLLYRSPTTTPEENASFYQSDYSQGFTTEMPDEVRLLELTSTKFSQTEKDFSRYIEVLAAIGAKPGDRVLDFGCSWGYGSWQFKQHGFHVESFEISQPRAAFARDKLGISVTSNMSEISGPFDVFFSSHVLEHVPSVKAIIDYAFERLRPGGTFVQRLLRTAPLPFASRIEFNGTGIGGWCIPIFLTMPTTKWRFPISRFYLPLIHMT